MNNKRARKCESDATAPSKPNRAENVNEIHENIPAMEKITIAYWLAMSSGDGESRLYEIMLCKASCCDDDMTSAE